MDRRQRRSRSGSFKAAIVSPTAGQGPHIFVYSARPLRALHKTKASSYNAKSDRVSISKHLDSLLGMKSACVWTRDAVNTVNLMHRL